MFAPLGPRRLLVASCCIAASLAFAPALAAADEPAPTPPAGTSPAPAPPADEKGVIDTAKLKQGACKKGDLEMPDGCLTNPVLKKKVSPKYPEAARQAHINGKITIKATIGTDGKLSDVAIVSCTPPGKGFEESTIAAVRQWEYSPATSKGQPVPVSFTVEIEFFVQGGDRLPVGRPASER